VQQIPGESGLQGAEIGEGSGLVAGGQEFLRPHVEQLGGGGEAGAVVAIGAEHGVVEIHLLGEAVEGGTRRMNAGGETLAIVGAEALVAAGDVEDRRIQLLVEGFGKDSPIHSRPGVGESFSKGITTRVRPVETGPARGHFGRRSDAQKRKHPTTTRTAAAFHGNSIISAGDGITISGGAVAQFAQNLLPLRTRRDTKERPKILVEDSAGFGGQAPHTLLLHTVLVHTSITPAQPSSSVQRFLVPSVRISFSSFFSGRCWRGRCRIVRWRTRTLGGTFEPARDSGDALAATHRCIFFADARSTVVCLGVAVRHCAWSSAPGLRN